MLLSHVNNSMNECPVSPRKKQRYVRCRPCGEVVFLMFYWLMLCSEFEGSVAGCEIGKRPR